MSSSAVVSEADENRATLLWADGALLGVALIWGTNIPVMKSGLDGIDSYVFNAVRLCVSALVLAGFAVAERRRGIRAGAELTYRQVLVFGLIIGAVYQLCFLMGIARTTSGNTGLIIATVPAWTALLARIFLGETLRLFAWAGICVALTGTVVVALQKGDVSVEDEHLVGNLMVLAAAVAWSGGTVYSRRLLKSISPIQLAAAGALIGLPFHLLVAAGRYEESLYALSAPAVWGSILYAGVLSSGLALPMWNFGVRHAGAAHASIIQNLVPLVAIVVAWLMRGESITPAQLVGGVLIITGLVMMRAVRDKTPDLLVTAQQNESTTDACI